MNDQPLTILKIGGAVLEQAAARAEMLRVFAALPRPAILVHGGGRRADELSRQLGIEPLMVEGRRITDAPTLEIVTMVYAGSLNKELVAALQALGCNAVGLSGADGDVIRAHQRRGSAIDYGFAGDIDVVNTALLKNLLSIGLVPVICPITHDGAGQLLNTNADTIAATLAVALAADFAVSLRYSFERPGVLADPRDDDSVIASLDAVSYRRYREAGVITAGMIPKLDNAFSALASGVREVVIGNAASIGAGRATVLRGI